jgi:hypothetical protein
MARKANLKFLLREELARMKEAGYGRSKYKDKERTNSERAKLQAQGVSYRERLKVDYSKNYIYVSTTFESYYRQVGYFANWIAEEKGLKKISIVDSTKYIQEYINYLDKEKSQSPWSINLALSAICKATGMYLVDYKHPKRSIAHLKRGVGEKPHDVLNNSRARESLEKNKLLGLRRTQLCRLKSSDIREVEINGIKMVIVETMGKGKKLNQQIFYNKDEMEAVLKLKEGKDDNDKIFDKHEFDSDADYHSMRELRCKYVYESIVKDIQEHPERKEFYQGEIHRLFKEAGRKVREDLKKPVYTRGENRERLLKKECSIEFDRTALLFCAVTITSHWRTSVILEHYVGK